MKKLERKHHSRNFTFGLFVFNIFKIPVRRYSEKPEHFSQETFPNAPGGSRTFQRARAVVYFTCERRFMSLLMDGAAIPGGMGEPGPPGALVSSPRPWSGQTTAWVWSTWTNELCPGPPQHFHLWLELRLNPGLPTESRNALTPSAPPDSASAAVRGTDPQMSAKQSGLPGHICTEHLGKTIINTKITAHQLMLVLLLKRLRFSFLTCR